MMESQKVSQKQISGIGKGFKAFTDFFFVRDLEKKHKDEFYAIDVFDPTKFIRNCRIIAGVLTAVTIFLILFLSSQLNPVAFIPVEYMLLLQAVSVVATILLYPYYLQAITGLAISITKSEKNSEISANFYSALCIISGCAKGETPLGETIRLLANSKLKGIKEEFAKISTSLYIHGLDIKTALLKAALTTTHEKLAYFLRGLANYIEERKNYDIFVENFLQVDNINRKIELSAFSDKIRNIVSIFLALLTACITMALISITSTDEYLGSQVAIISIYIGIPLSALMIVVMMHVGNPIKERNKEKGKEAMILVLTCAALGLIVSSLSFTIYANYKTYLLALPLAVAIFGYAYTFNARRKEKRITEELDSFLMKLRAASELRSNILDAIDPNTTIGKEILPTLSLTRVAPAGDVLLRASNETKHPFLSLVLYVLSTVIHRTKRISDVILSLIYEYHRYLELIKLRKSVFSITVVFSLVSIVIIAVCMGILKFQLIPVFAKVAASGAVKFDAILAKHMAEDSIIVIATTTPAALGAVSGDFRKCFSLFLILLPIAILFTMF